MTMSPFRLAVAAALASAVASAACDIKVDNGNVSLGVSRGRASDEWTRTYSLPTGGRLEILNENGQIEARGTTGTQVEVKAFREVTDSSDEAAQERLQRLVMREEVSADRVIIEAEKGQANDRGGPFRGVSVRYEVQVPAGLVVNLRTLNGAVRLEGLTGTVKAETTNGVVTGSGVSGPVEASTVNGSVQLNLTSVAGDVTMRSVNGAVRLEVPAAIDADLEATTVNGRVAIDDQFGIRGTDDRAGFPGARTNVSGRINKGGPRISLRTTNGGVRMAVRDSGGG